MVNCSDLFVFFIGNGRYYINYNVINMMNMFIINAYTYNNNMSYTYDKRD